MLQIIEKLQNNDVIICSSAHKEAILKEFFKKKKIISVIFKTKNDFILDILGSYKEKAYITLAKEENTLISIAKIKLDYSYFVDECYENEKLKNLFDIKKKYQTKEYFNFPNIDFYKNKNIYIINNDNTDDLFYLAKKKIEQHVLKIEIVNANKQPSNNKIYLNEFSNINQEVTYIVESIAINLKNGVESKNIKVHTPTDAYYAPLKEYFALYNIDVDLQKNSYLYEYSLTQKFLEKLKNYYNDECYLGFSNALNELEDGNIIKNNIISLLNGIDFSDYKVCDIYDYLVFKLSNTLVKKEDYENIITFTNILDANINQEDIIYFLGFNQDILPITYKDNDYLSDLEKKQVNALTSSEKNKLEKEKWLNLIKSLKEAYISYSLEAPGESLVKSSFLDILGKEISLEKNSYKENELRSFSKEALKISYFKEKDQYDKYGTISKKFLLYNNIFKDCNKYDNKFKGIDKEKFLLDNKNKFDLSYTQINLYYQCPFRYYLERVLKIKKENNTESLFVGDLFHYCLQKFLEEYFLNTKKYSNDWLDNTILDFLNTQNEEVDKRKELFLSFYKEILIENFNFLSIQASRCNFKIDGLEKEYKIDTKLGDTNFSLTGKIDKVLTLKMRNQKYAIVVDYKSGDSDFTFDYLEDGINLQVMVYYIFLRSKEPISFGGAYLANVCPSSPLPFANEKTYGELLRKEFALSGYSNEDKFILSQIDCKYDEPDGYIKGISLKKDGSFSSRTQNRILTESEFEKLLKISEERVVNAFEKIKNAEFNINPYRIGDNLTCQSDYCPYKDICFMTNKDIKQIDKKEKLELIRGKQ